MSKTTTRSSGLPLQPRKVHLLQNTYSQNNAKLDFRSHLFLKWTDKWVTAAGGIKSPHSGLIRRALSVYSKHLESLPPSEAPRELRSIKAACTGTSTPPDEQDAAEARLGACSSPLPAFEVVLLGQYVVDETARMLKHLEQFNQLSPQRQPNPSRK